jgi:crotonobetainyl-CoA:carnitine CoA-transferase CaiB-like acyl-CoA transferase
MALLDVQTSVLANQAMNYLASGKSPRRMGNAHPNIVPYQVFPVADGHVIVAVGNDGQFARFVSVLGRPELAQDERFRTNAGRVGHRAELVPILTEFTLKTTRDALLEALEKQGVPAGPINTVADVFADPQVIARGMRIDLPSSAAKGGAIPSVRSPIIMNGEPMAAERPSPRLGEHTDEVLSDPSWMA